MPLLVYENGCVALHCAHDVRDRIFGRDVDEEMKRILGTVYLDDRDAVVAACLSDGFLNFGDQGLAEKTSAAACCEDDVLVVAVIDVRHDLYFRRASAKGM